MGDHPHFDPREEVPNSAAKPNHSSCDEAGLVGCAPTVDGGCKILHQLVIRWSTSHHFIGGLSGFNHPILAVFTSLQNPGIHVSPESNKLDANQIYMGFPPKLWKKKRESNC